KEVVIEANPHGILGSDRAWEAGINHPDLMQYTNAIWTEDNNNPRWENGVAIGKFRTYKLGRTTNNFILTYNNKPNDFAEDLALNRTIGFLGESVPTGIQKKYLDFWLVNKELYIHAKGAEKVAVLRSYPSMAYNTLETQVAVNMAEQALQQRQIPFDIIFDQQIGRLSDYSVIVLANQESLTDSTIDAIKTFAANGGGIVVTGNAGKYDKWRRLRKQNLPDVMLAEENKGVLADTTKNSYTFSYGEGKVYYIPKLIQPKGEVKLGYETTWQMPLNANELASAVYWVSGQRLPLEVKAPEWVGVSHDTQKNREVVHLFNYKTDENVGGITLEYNGLIKSAWSVSPDEDGKSIIPIIEKGGITELRIPNLKVYKVIVLEK
ncbi:MAG: beta-galactosidase trimerization domain-containing protein, partial [Bacteroidetes bacterium]|nr:beta-galactosidase trimerization domain-containing protein [Bacteroidota bacterium]